MTEQTEPAVRVIFRVYLGADGGDVVAIFPDLPGTREAGSVTVYQHVGQHGTADYATVITMTRPAKPAEYAALARELRTIGYTLDLTHPRNLTPFHPDVDAVDPYGRL